MNKFEMKIRGLDSVVKWGDAPETEQELSDYIEYVKDSDTETYDSVMIVLGAIEFICFTGKAE